MQSQDYVLLSDFNEKKTITPVNVQQDFVDRFAPLAYNIQVLDGIPMLFSLSQCALETGWGRELSGNMCFGMKATGSSYGGWQGETQLLHTWECGWTGNSVKDRIGVPANQILKLYKPNEFDEVRKAWICKNMFAYRINDSFRRYATIEDSWNDWAGFMRALRPRAFQFKNNAYMFAKEASNYYSTDPKYFEGIRSVMLMVEPLLKQSSFK